MTVEEASSRPSTRAGRPHASIRFRVADWTAATLGDSGDGTEELSGAARRAAGVSLPALLRRRVTPIGHSAFRAATSLGETAAARFIFCSRHGEFRRTKALLETLARGEPLSPAEFSLAVHNALAGLLSIAWKNEIGHTAIAAGTDSFGFGLLEAGACLEARPAEPILLVYFDEILPGEYADFREGEEASLALALLLTAAEGGRDDVLVSLAPKSRDETARPAAEQALDFIRFLLSGESERTFPGGSVQWRWHRHAA